MSLMNDLAQYIDIKQADSAQQNQGFSQIGNVFGQAMKERDDEKRRQENVKKQMSDAQKMLQAMSQMPNNSAASRVVGTLDDDVQKRRKGVINVSDFISDQSMSVDENGAINLKFGTRRATPQEQKAQFEMQKSQIDMEKAQAKSDLLSSYIKGDVQEGAILGEMSTLGITADEFDIASQARQRMQNVPQAIPQGFAATEMIRDKMGNMVPSGIKQVQPPMSVAQPTEMDKLREEQARLNIEKTKRELATQSVTEQGQVAGQQEPFRFKTDKTVAEQKFAAEQADIAKKAQLESNMVTESAQDTLSTINEIEKNIKYFGAAGNIPAFPAEYEKQNWQANIDKLQSKLVVDLMAKMKQASKTGATGFGALSEKELKVLQSAATALRKGMSEEDAQRYINEIKASAKKVLGGESQSISTGSVPSVGGTFNGEKVISVKRIR